MIALRGARLAALLVAGPAFAQAPMPGAYVVDLSVLLARADAALAGGDARAASEAYGQATLLRHDAGIETGLLRAQMQSGDYRRALAFAAHVAGAHRDAANGAALYAWLLHVGAQATAARTQIDTALRRWPDDAAVRWVHEALAGTPPAEDAPLRLGPHPSGSDVPAHARVVAGGVLVSAQRALVPAGALVGAGPHWVRDGLGRARAARIETIDAALAIAVLALDAPLDEPKLALAPGAFPGSPAFALGHAAAAAHATWPAMSVGFLAAPRDGGERPIGVEVPSSGGPVFDHHARLVGLHVDGTFVPAAALQRWLPAASPAALPRATPDAIYETALPITLQLITGTAPGRPSPG